MTTRRHDQDEIDQQIQLSVDESMRRMEDELKEAMEYDSSVNHQLSQGQEINLDRVQALEFGRRLVEEYKCPEVLCQHSEDQNTMTAIYLDLCGDGEEGKISSADATTVLDDGKSMRFLLHALACNIPLCALNIYHAYYEHDNTKLLSYSDIGSNPILKDMYLSWGANSIAFAGVTAAYWYLSEQPK